MAARFTYDSAEEDWDLNTLHVINSQLESYLKMLPGGGYDMTLTELQDMASRQQQQIESQQQILVAKEQRLKYLKQQEQKQQRLVSENDRLRKLRDRVEAQEMKLKKLRALRGQVEEHRAHNGNLNFELETIKHLFNEKEKELAMAVTKVEEMTRQLEDIRSGRVKSATTNNSPAAMAELEKLKKELMIRNKLNEQQNMKMGTNRELLLKRKEEVARMDNRIHELQMRLKKKRALEAEIGDKNQLNKPNINNKLPHRPVPNVAAVEPYIPEPHTDNTVDDIKTSNSGFGKKDPKYKSLPASSKLSHSDKGMTNKPREQNNNTVDYNRKHLEPDKSDDYTIPLVVTVDSNGKANQSGPPLHKPSSTGHLPPPYSYNSGHAPDAITSTGSAMNNVRYGTAVPARSGISHLTPRPFGSTYSTAVVPNRSGVGVPKDHPRFEGQEDIRQAGSGQSSPGSIEGQEGPHKQSPQLSPSQLKGQDVPPLPTRSANTQDKNHIPTSQSHNSARHNNHNNITNDGESEQTSISVSKGIEKFSGLIAQNQPPGSDRTDSGHGWSNLNHASALGAVSHNAPTYRYAPKSVIANTYLPKFDSEAFEKYQKNVLSLHRDLISGSRQKESVSDDKPEKLKTVSGEAPMTQEENDSLSPLSSQNSPLSSTSTPSPASPSRQAGYSFDFPQTPPHADVASDKVSYKPNTPKNIRRRHSDSDNEEVGKALHKYQINTNKNNLPTQENHLLMLENANGAIEIQATSFSNHIPETSEVLLLDSSGNIVEVTDNSKDTSHETDESDKQTVINVEVKTDNIRKKTNLKSSNSKKNPNRVSFDPLALLMDASLEGELELVKQCARQVENVSASNDEGITALHNAICTGHYEIVTFLVEFGCDVDSPDSDGWTPLHCAASCNNLPMVKYLVEHGACIYATTISDHRTAAEKCDDDADGYDDCAEYLYSIQEKLGIMNNGAVYAVFDYERESEDELDMHIGEMFAVLRKGDMQEKEWWWSRVGTREGYLPRNLLGLTPRVLPKSPHSPEV